MRKKIVIEYILFPQLHLTYLLKTERKWLFFVIGFVIIPYNLMVLMLYLIGVFLLLSTFFIAQNLKNIFIKK
jgi:hypothetical protein|tara:strand:- start:517 stop:732 length:216 start_codon:yes stop_codon:yes gene_type:complete